MNFWLIFLTGITTGGISCVAMQGGLLASMIASQKGKELKNSSADTKSNSFDPLDWKPVVFFLGSKLLAYTLLGALLGLAGSYFSLSLEARLVFQLAAAFFMFATALNLLDVHPIFRFVVLQPPKFIQRKIWKSTKESNAYFGPAVLGFLTIFIPCGVTQAMEVVAISSGSALNGALTMFAFVLGTAPLFAFIGIATAKFSEEWKGKFLQVAAVVLILMSLSSVNGVLTVVDSPFSLNRIVQTISAIGQPPSWYGKQGQDTTETVADENGVQKVTITIDGRGYTPTFFAVKAGTPVEMTLSTTNAYSCASSFTFKKFNIFEQLGPTDTKKVTFTPTEKGSFTYSCSMGMFSGTMQVI